MPYTDGPPGWWREFVLATPARTAVPPEMVVRVEPTKIVAKIDVAD